MGGAFDTDEFVAASAIDDAEAFSRLDDALDAGIIEPTEAGYRFRHGIVRDVLLDGLPPHRKRIVHRDTADRLIELAASPARIGHHLLQAGEGAEAVPYVLRSAETEAGLGAYRDALEQVDGIMAFVSPRTGSTPCASEGTCCAPSATLGRIAVYRQGLEFGRGARGPPAAGPARLEPSLMGGDLATAGAALQGLEPDGGPDDADILLVRGECAVLRGRPRDGPGLRRCGPGAGPGGGAELAGARSGDAAGPAVPRERGVVRPHEGRAAPHQGEPRARQRRVRRLPLRHRVHGLRTHPARRDHRRRPGPPGHGRAQRRPAGGSVRRRPGGGGGPALGGPRPGRGRPGRGPGHAPRAGCGGRGGGRPPGSGRAPHRRGPLRRGDRADRAGPHPRSFVDRGPPRRAAALRRAGAGHRPTRRPPVR